MLLSVVVCVVRHGGCISRRCRRDHHHHHHHHRRRRRHHRRRHRRRRRRHRRRAVCFRSLIFVSDDERGRCVKLLETVRTSGAAAAKVSNRVTDNDLWYAQKGEYRASSSLRVDCPCIV